MEFDKERGITDDDEVSTIERSFRVLQPITDSDPTEDQTLSGLTVNTCRTIQISCPDKVPVDC
jgi:hypothetical protein